MNKDKSNRHNQSKREKPKKSRKIKRQIDICSSWDIEPRDYS